MPFYIIHAGTALKKVDVYGNLTTLSLPAGVTVVNTKPARYALLDKILFICNAPTKNLVMEGSLAVRLAGLVAPTGKPTVAAGAAGVLNGKYYTAYTYAIKVSGKVVAESPLSPVSDQSAALVNSKLSIANITVGAETGTNCRRIYRSSSGGGGGAATLFHCHDIDDNATTVYESNEADADLDPLPVSLQDLGTPPTSIKLVTEWRDRLWGVSTTEVDNLRYSGEKAPWAWKATNMFPIGPVGEDNDGITGFVRRRDELGVGRRRVLWKIVGSSSSDFRRIKVVEGIGIWAPDSVAVVRDTGLFLAEDGVYAWSPDGVLPVAEDQVRPWFTTDDYFNRSLFSKAFARYDPRWNVYELHLAAAGSSNIDRWVGYDIRRKVWYGPHKTDAFTPTSGGLMENASGLAVTMLASGAGTLYLLNQPGFSDAGTAIAFDVKARHHCNTPDVQKYFGDASVHSKPLLVGVCTLRPRLGNVGPNNTIVPAPANDTSDIDVHLNLGRERLRRLGTGGILDLEFLNSQDGQEVEIYGYEIPWHEFGRR
jgi:hypothetical protein